VRRCWTINRSATSISVDRLSTIMRLDVDDIRASYGLINVLNNVSLSRAQGELLGVLGHNGMGKTTLPGAIMGLLPLTGGDIRLDGNSIRDRPAYARPRLGFGYVPEGRQIFPQLTVRENLAIAAVANGRRASPAIEQVPTDFAMLKNLVDRIGGSLSGGEQQILALGRSLCGDPKLILLDEPTEGVQPSIIEQMTEVLGKLYKERAFRSFLSSKISISSVRSPAGLSFWRRAESSIPRKKMFTPTLWNQSLPLAFRAKAPGR
jgi:branched-chain amino acid transport system ATP-binding protein